MDTGAECVIPALRNEPRFETRSVRVGVFRAHPDDAAFSTAGLPSLPTFVFPRSAVWIEHQGRRPFVADPNVITLYNPGAQYRRRALRRGGDRCDWFQVSEDMFRRAARRFFPGEPDPEVPFRSLRVRADPQLYLQQRLLTRYVRETETPDPRRVDEAVAGLLERVLSLARATADAGRALRRLEAVARHRELVERTRAELDLRFREGAALAELSARLDTSVHHLCRVFKRGTGITIHEYQTRLRMAEALERIRGDDHLIDTAFHLGFSSHSHFTERFRQVFGFAPSRFREMGHEASLAADRGR